MRYNVVPIRCYSMLDIIIQYDVYLIIVNVKLYLRKPQYKIINYL